MGGYHLLAGPKLVLDRKACLRRENLPAVRRYPEWREQFRLWEANPGELKRRGVWLGSTR